MRSLVLAAGFVVATLLTGHARADDPASGERAAPRGACTPAAPATWGVSPQAVSTDPTPPPSEDTPVNRARDLLARARLLDEAAASDDRAANEIAARLPTLRATAKAARERADRASGPDRETLVARAEDLEADVAISEAETTAKRRSAVDNRRVARELRTRAVQLVKTAPVEPPSCDPPYRYTADGRKVYRIECLK